MCGYYDVYVLSSQRNEAFIAAFLKAFLPLRRETADEYEIPRFADQPDMVFNHDQELITYCCQHVNTEQAVYWANPNRLDEPRAAMVFFTEDQHVIVGLSTSELRLAKQYLQRIQEFSASEIGYIDFESPPAMSKVDFLAMLNP